MLDIQRLRKDYNILKNHAFEFYKQNAFASTFRSIIACANIGYGYNFIDEFSDDSLDSLIAEISNRQLTVNKFESETNKVVFYDSFAIDSRGLTEQYLRALIELKYEVLYIVSNDEFYGQANNIVKMIKNSPNCSYIILSESLTFIERAQIICDRIQIFKPSKAFMHFSPWDVVGFMVFTRLEGYLKRYFINITDHAFWLGKNTFDACLEFRNYGFALSNKVRGIDKDKIFLLPYYPILQSNDDFLGLEFQDKLQGKLVGITGGTGYKYLDKDFTYYKLVKTMLIANNDFVLIMVGTGSAGKKLKEFAEKDGFIDRIFLLHERPDIFPLLQKADIYLSSYPFGGGLMTQLAAEAGLPILLFSNPDFQFNFLEELLPYRKPNYHTFTSFEETLKVATLLVSDSEYRRSFKELTDHSVITPDEFKENLNIILTKGELISKDNLQTYNFTNLSDIMSGWSIDVENEFNRKYDSFIQSLICDLPEILKYDFVPVWKTKKTFRRRIGSIRHYLRKLNKYVNRKTKKIKAGFARKTLAIFDIDYNAIRKSRIEYDFKKIGQKCIFPDNARIINPQAISIGDNFFSMYNLRLEAIDSYQGERFYPELTIGDNFLTNTDFHVGCINKVTIGNNVLIASKVFISDHFHGDSTGTFSHLAPGIRPLTSRGPVIIEDDVWVGEGVCIMPNVTLGRNCIVGSNSVVTKSFPANSIIAGNPAKLIRTVN